MRWTNTFNEQNCYSVSFFTHPDAEGGYAVSIPGRSSFFFLPHSADFAEGDRDQAKENKTPPGDEATDKERKKNSSIPKSCE